MDRGPKRAVEPWQALQEGTHVARSGQVDTVLLSLGPDQFKSSSTIDKLGILAVS